MRRVHLLYVLIGMTTSFGFAPQSHAQAAGAPCAESVVLVDCPNQQASPFQSESQRADAAQRQLMLDRFAQAQAIARTNSGSSDDDMGAVTIYGQSERSSAPTPVAQFTQDVNQAGAKDCRTGYATSGTGGQFGLSDVVVDTVTGHACSWR